MFLPIDITVSSVNSPSIVLFEVVCGGSLIIWVLFFEMDHLVLALLCLKFQTPRLFRVELSPLREQRCREGKVTIGYARDVAIIGCNRLHEFYFLF